METMIGLFIGNSILLGVALAMDAFSVSVAHGLSAPNMKSSHMMTIAGVFAFFQFLMPMIGWICVHTIAQQFVAFEKAVPWIALILLAALGINMIREGVQEKRMEAEVSDGVEANAVCNANDRGVYDSGTRGTKNTGMRLAAGVLLAQGIATSIDALSVGFTISSYRALMAFAASLIIAIVTFAICVGGVKIGQKIGERFNSYATIIGGLILIAIGLEIFIQDLVA
jgi:putative Mn2+ efflux pump MntP